MRPWESNNFLKPGCPRRPRWRIKNLHEAVVFVGTVAASDFSSDLLTGARVDNHLLWISRVLRRSYRGEPAFLSVFRLLQKSILLWRGQGNNISRSEACPFVIPSNQPYALLRTGQHRGFKAISPPSILGTKSRRITF